MLLSYALAVMLVVIASARNLGYRNMQLPEEKGGVQLREFVVRATIHGKCNFKDKSGRDVMLIYEETNDEVLVKSLDPSVDDPVAAIRECRAAASVAPKTVEMESTNQNPETQISPYEIQARYNELSRLKYENQHILQPRILNWIGNKFGLENLANFGSFSQTNPAQSGFGLSWGGSDVSPGIFPSLPSINLMPSNGVSQLANTVTYGNGHDQDLGPWGVLNQIQNSNKGNFFRSPFTFLNPFSFKN